MVMRRCILLLLLFVTLPCLAAPGLHLDVGKSEVELGRTIGAELYGIETPVDPGQLDLSQLRDLFGVEIPGIPAVVEDDRWPVARVERLRLRLTPKTTGEVTLPAIVAGELATEPRVISVRQGTVKGEPLAFRSSLSTGNPWERQQVILWAEVSTPEPFARLTLEEWQPQGFEAVPLPFARKREGDRFRIGIGWALFPLVPGEHRLEIPPVAYRISGGIKRRYYFSADRLDVNALPPYILPTTPVGRVTLTSSVDPAGPLESAALANWHLRLEGAALTPRRLPPVRGQIHAGDAVTFLPEKIVRQSQPDRQGVHGSLSMHLPFKPASAGRLALPTLRIDYFDPATGRLETLLHTPQRPFVYHPWMPVLAATLAILLAGWLLVVLVPRLSERYRRLRARRALFAEMAGAETPSDLRKMLGRLAALEGWGSNLSLQQWASCWKAQRARRGFGSDDSRMKAFDRVVGELSRSCYAATGHAGFAATRDRLLGLIN